jgi:hypothetical protein
MKSLSLKELTERADKLYHKKGVKKIFGNEYGQFSYRVGDLIEPHKPKEVKVWLFNADGKQEEGPKGDEIDFTDNKVTEKKKADKKESETKKK